MRILLLTHAFNSLTQRLAAELRQCGHEISIELDIADTVTEEALTLFRPELIVAPYLKRAIPELGDRLGCHGLAGAGRDGRGAGLGQRKLWLERVEAQIIHEAMLRHKGNKTRVGLRMKLMRLELEKDRTLF